MDQYHECRNSLFIAFRWVQEIEMCLVESGFYVFYVKDVISCCVHSKNSRNWGEQRVSHMLRYCIIGIRLPRKLASLFSVISGRRVVYGLQTVFVTGFFVHTSVTNFFSLVNYYLTL
mgnify:CR=1 FL=1